MVVSKCRLNAHLREWIRLRVFLRCTSQTRWYSLRRNDQWYLGYLANNFSLLRCLWLLRQRLSEYNCEQDWLHQSQTEYSPKADQWYRREHYLLLQQRFIWHLIILTFKLGLRVQELVDSRFHLEVGVYLWQGYLAYLFTILRTVTSLEYLWVVDQLTRRCSGSSWWCLRSYLVYSCLLYGWIWVVQIRELCH